MDTVHECDRRTDGRTDRITITKTVQTASHGKNDVIHTWSYEKKSGPTKFRYCVVVKKSAVICNFASSHCIA